MGEGVLGGEREAGGSHPQNSGRRDNAVTSLRLESRLTAAPRTGILDTMRSVEACNPRVGDANPPVGEGGERRGGSNIVYRPRLRMGLHRRNWLKILLLL